MHFDAHTDTHRQRREFDRHHVLCRAERRAYRSNHSVQIGIAPVRQRRGFTVLDAGQVNDRSVDDVITRVKQIVSDMPVYLTFDIDCLDRRFAPGTGYPGYPGGLTSDRAIKLWCAA
ncbi:arginase family protein [Klebsiella pneumoniae]|nr:arginase family protein [Klebsiella pneumoniae]